MVVNKALKEEKYLFYMKGMKVDFAYSISLHEQYIKFKIVSAVQPQMYSRSFPCKIPMKSQEKRYKFAK